MLGEYIQNAFNTNVFVAKISPDGTHLIYYTQVDSAFIIRGGFSISPQALAIAPDGSAYAVVSSSVLRGPALMSSQIFKVSPGGDPEPYTNYQLNEVDPSDDGLVNDIAVDLSGNVYLTGTDSSVASTPGSLSGTNGSNSFIVKTDSAGKVIYAIHNYGGLKIAVDAAGNVFTVGADPFGVTATAGVFQTNLPSGGCNVANQSCPNDQYLEGVNSTGTALLFATYLSSGAGESPAGIAVDAGGNVYVAGSTGSANYPTTPGALEPVFQATKPDSLGHLSAGYVSALNPAGDLLFSTYFGGSDYDTITSISLDQQNGVLYLAGEANSPDLPGIFGVYRNCVPQAFLSGLTTDGTAVTRTLTVAPGSAPLSVATAPNNIAWIAASGILSTQADQLAQVDFDTPDTPIACLADSAGVVVTGTVTPGQLLTLFGNGLSAATSIPQPTNGMYATSGIDASATAAIQVLNTGVTQAIDSLAVPVVPVNPSIFEVSADSAGCMAAYLGQSLTLAINQDGTVNGCGNPAQAGSTITIFVDGLGVTSLAQATGALISSATPLAASDFFPPSPPISIVSLEAVPGAISGVYEIQIQVSMPGSYALFGALGNVEVQIAP